MERIPLLPRVSLHVSRHRLDGADCVLCDMSKLGSFRNENLAGCGRPGLLLYRRRLRILYCVRVLQPGTLQRRPRLGVSRLHKRLPGGFIGVCRFRYRRLHGLDA